MRYFRILYNSSLWAMVIAITCFRSMWLEMRVNTGYIFFGTWLILTILAVIRSRYREQESRKRGWQNIIYSVINVSICVLYGWLLYGTKRIQVVPATIIRRGMHQTGVPFRVINRWVVIFLAAGLISILAADISAYQRQKNQG